MVKSAKCSESIKKKARKSDCSDNQSRECEEQQIFIINRHLAKKDPTDESLKEGLIKAEALLQYFIGVYREMSGYEARVYTSDEIEVIKRFEQLSLESKLLFIDLFTSEFRWVEANLIKNKLLNISKSIVELENARLINTSSTVLLCQDPQETYTFLYNLRFVHVKTLKKHLKKQLIALYSINSVEFNVDKPWNSLLHYYSKLSTLKSLFCELGKEIVEEGKNSRAKKIQSIFQSLNYFIEKLEIDQMQLLDFLTPPDFPRFFKLDNDVAFFFSRIHHAASHYSGENIFANFIPYLNNKVKPILYRNTLLTHPIILNYEDTVESESAYSFELLLEKLIKKNLNEACYKISKEIIKFRNVCELNLTGKSRIVVMNAGREYWIYA